jgi:putative transposase
MGRPRRILLPFQPAHIVHRGNNRQGIFHCDGDYLFFTRCLRDGAVARGVDVHAYVLMTNHVHLLMTPKQEGAISAMIQSVARRYVGYYNERYTRTGTLWEGRFYSSRVTSDRYFLTCHQYIDMNPVRAGLTESPGGYLWSSHNHYAVGRPDSLLSAHPMILAMAPNEAGREREYRKLFAGKLSDKELEEIRDCLRRNSPLGVPRKKAGRPRKKVSDTNFHAAGQVTARSWAPG